MPLERDVTIVGGGLAAIRTAQALRALGFEGAIALISEEVERPYDRPPLSKDFLRGHASEDDIRLLTPARCEELDLELLLGERAVALDPATRRVSLAGGEEVAYRQLVVATGARPQRLPAVDGYGNVLYLRTLEDARALRDALPGRPRVGIVGGGFVGLEVAAVATELGCVVTVVEGAPAPLATALGPQLGGWLRAWHEEHGVRFRCESLVRHAHGDSVIEELELSDGSRIPVDVIVVGIGVTPAVEWLRTSGLTLHRGLRCDQTGRSSAPRVFGVGDAVCRHVGEHCRLSGHWTGAAEQAQLVAATMLGAGDAHRSVDEGYFWSDQYDVRLQFTGSVPPDAQITVTSGRVEDRRFVALCGDADRVTGVFGMGSPREFLRRTLELRAANATGVGA